MFLESKNSKSCKFTCEFEPPSFFSCSFTKFQIKLENSGPLIPLSSNLDLDLVVSAFLNGSLNGFEDSLEVSLSSIFCLLLRNRGCCLADIGVGLVAAVAACFDFFVELVLGWVFSLPDCGCWLVPSLGAESSFACFFSVCFASEPLYLS